MAHDEGVKRLGCLLSTLVLVTSGCGQAPSATGTGPAVTVLFGGDLMLGRGVAPIAAADPIGLFEDVRFAVRSADIAVANLESPLTRRPHHDPAVHALEADPASARLAAEAGFDVLGLANNHAGDAGRDGITDSMEAVVGAGMVSVGAGRTAAEANEPVVVERNGLRVALLAFDATGMAPTAGHAPGVATWDPAEAEQAVRQARRDADVVAVGIHGGVEYLTRTDTYLAGIAEQLAGWGVDIVWGHGAHVVQPVYVIEEGDRPTVVATSLGNLLFDQDHAHRGALLEVTAGSDGVRAFRIGATEHQDRRVHLTGWADPVGDAVLVDGRWWTLLADVQMPPPAEVVAEFSDGEVVAAATGSVTDGPSRELVVSFRRPYQETLVNQAYPDIAWADSAGRSAHLGVYELETLESIWVAGSLSRPVAALAVCDGALALAFDSLEDARILATAAWEWDGFGFRYSAELGGPGVPACADVDGDGRFEPAVVGRSQ